MKVMIVVLVAIAVAVVLVLFYGAVRPEGDAGAAQGGVEGGFGWLVPRPTLAFADVADASCADPTVQGFVVPSNGACGIPLPAPSQIALCVEDPSTVAISTDGSEYPAQPVKASSLSCADPKPVAIYDTDTVLTIRCLVLAQCVVLVRD
ncbi:hypothetical protein ACH3VR_13580 [Microbacterium sp. B2969]|uniref:Secreted protein n=1 Tax=Microbacterium alkaliflavum TaxID=3248839 RepID=A0ABW7QB87_9MICO